MPVEVKMKEAAKTLDTGVGIIRAFVIICIHGEFVRHKFISRKILFKMCGHCHELENSYV